MAYARQVKRRRGTESENNAFTGAEGEIVVDTTNHRLRVHDGATLGGFPIPNFNDLNELKTYLENLLAAIPRVPAGLICGWSGRTLPPGHWLWCRGGRVNISDYPELANYCGSTYGPVSDGMFYLPNANDATLFAYANEDGGLQGMNDAGSLPNIWGAIDIQCEGGYNAAVQNWASALAPRGNTTNICRPSSSGRAQRDYGFDFNASRSHSLYGKGYYSQNRVVPAALWIPGFIISY